MGFAQETRNRTPDSVTIPDCKFLVIATNITLATLERQIRSISASIELYKKLQEIYTEAGTSEENLPQIFLEKTDFFGDEISTEEPAESAEKEEPNT